MGAQQEPTEAMGPYRTEIRGESFYLTVSGPTAEFFPERVDRHTLRVPPVHTGYLLAALDQVTAHRGWTDWSGTPREGGITVSRGDGNVLELVLPLPVYAQAWNDEDGRDTSLSTEIEYADVADLRAQITTAFPNTVTPVGHLTGPPVPVTGEGSADDPYVIDLGGAPHTPRT